MKKMFNEPASLKDETLYPDQEKKDTKSRTVHDPVEVSTNILERIISSSLSISNFSSVKNIIQRCEYLLGAYRKSPGKNENPSIRLITHLEKKNEELFPIIQSMTAQGIEIRHFESEPLIEFGIFDSKECYFSTNGPEGNCTLFTSDNLYVDHIQHIFENLWSNSVDARKRISEIRNSHLSESTEIISARPLVKERSLKIIQNSQLSLDAIVNSQMSKTLAKHPEYHEALLECHRRGVRTRLITEITYENLAECKKLIDELGFEIRHLDDVNTNMVMTESEFAADVSSKSPINSCLVCSSVREVVSENGAIFEMFWNKAIPAEVRMSDVEAGSESETIEVIKSTRQAKLKMFDIVESATKEVLFLFASVNGFHREENLGIIAKLEDSLKEGVNVRILSPLDEQIKKKIIGNKNWIVSSNEIVTQDARTPSPAILFRAIDPVESDLGMTMVVADGRRSLVCELRNDAAQNFEEAIGLSTYSNSRSTVFSHVAFFEKLWFETELRRSESVARRQLAESLAMEEKLGREARMLQDILAHDIRNYNQVIKLATEVLAEELPKDNDRIHLVLGALLNAVNGSTALLEKAKKLGRVMSEEDVELFNVDLLASIENSIALVKGGYNEKRKKIAHNLSVQTTGSDSPSVLADDLLDEVFTNIYSNAAKYTDGKIVSIDTRVEEIDGFWKISVSDSGHGIPDELKSRIFARYLRSARGSGLGMSIVHALVVDRYNGRLELKNRIPEDYKKGTKVEIILPKAKSDK